MAEQKAAAQQGDLRRELNSAPAWARRYILDALRRGGNPYGGSDADLPIRDVGNLNTDPLTDSPSIRLQMLREIQSVQGKPAQSTQQMVHAMDGELDTTYQHLNILAQVRNTRNALTQAKHARYAILNAEASGNRKLLEPLVGKVLSFVYTMWRTGLGGRGAADLYRLLKGNYSLAWFENQITRRGQSADISQYHFIDDEDKTRLAYKAGLRQGAARLFATPQLAASQEMQEKAARDVMENFWGTVSPIRVKIPMIEDYAKLIVLLEESMGASLTSVGSAQTASSSGMTSKVYAINTIKVVLSMLTSPPPSNANVGGSSLRKLEDLWNQWNTLIEAQLQHADTGLDATTFLIPRGFVSDHERKNEVNQYMELGAEAKQRVHGYLSNMYSAQGLLNQGAGVYHGVLGHAMRQTGVGGGGGDYTPQRPAEMDAAASAFYSKHPLLTSKKPYQRGTPKDNIAEQSSRAPHVEDHGQDDEEWKRELFEHVGEAGNRMLAGGDTSWVENLGDFGTHLLARQKYSNQYVPDAHWQDIVALKRALRQADESEQLELQMDRRVFQADQAYTAQIENATENIMHRFEEERLQEFGPTMERFRFEDTRPTRSPFHVVQPPFDALKVRGLTQSHDIGPAFMDLELTA